MSDPLTSPEESAPATDPKRQAEIANLQRRIARGFDAEAFMASDMGRYIRARANQELEQAQDALVDVDAMDTPKVRELQLQARVAARVLTYFADMELEAKAAEAQHSILFDAQHTD